MFLVETSSRSPEDEEEVFPSPKGIVKHLFENVRKFPLFVCSYVCIYVFVASSQRSQTPKSNFIDTHGPLASLLLWFRKCGKALHVHSLLSFLCTVTDICSFIMLQFSSLTIILTSVFLQEIHQCFQRNTYTSVFKEIYTYTENTPVLSKWYFTIPPPLGEGKTSHLSSGLF